MGAVPARASCECVEGWLWTEHGVRPCGCQLRRRQDRLRGYLDKEFGPRYAGADLATLQAQPQRHTRQPDLVREMQAHPRGSYALLGTQRIGKTYLGVALCRHAINQGRSAVGYRLQTYLDICRRWEFHEEERPLVWGEFLRSESAGWTILLDDLAAVKKASEFAAERFYDLVEAVYANPAHQLIVTSDLTIQELKQFWGAHDPQMGRRIIERILDVDGMTLFSGLFEGGRK
jgi:DNA replication protein DnaC